ncbi:MULTISPECIES: small multi-drug export protein [Paenibacillus]|uniref:Small multi-drug export protein n=2 Tax=Paenibacillus lactis TaxID=228574 RepID=G4H8N2_9BACL|nr:MULTISPECIES: small multi-drug export protein [Paenibacillus]EHB68217.1 hypothetical protein PaelaDRAFT_0343 [Paenibacillus lactis 154]MBP1894169.1 putative membrane protein [Paenibacillus lactis]GIO89477.1 hypothetical protein J31TS3_07040 [Paenibacillus lactis]HAF99648.1 hypothetical protein [Paenibacillus lactis]
MLNYIWLAAIAWFMGFFPMLEIFIAVPAAKGLGLDIVSSVFWCWLGNFFVIPFISYSYDWLTKFDKVKTYFMKLASSNACKKLNNGGFALVLIATPLLGSWGIGVAGKMIGMDRKRLFLASAIGIAIYGTIVGILTQLGIEAIFNPN